MRPDRLLSLFVEAAQHIPGIENVMTFAEAGYTERPYGLVTAVKGNGSVWWQLVVVTAPADREAEEPAPVTGPGPAPLAAVTLDPGARIRTAEVEEALAAAVLGADRNSEIAAISTFSTRPTPPAAGFGVALEFHSGARAFLMAMATRRAGESGPGRRLFQADATL